MRKDNIFACISDNKEEEILEEQFRRFFDMLSD
jgi:hypothetical protein